MVNDGIYCFNNCNGNCCSKYSVMLTTEDILRILLNTPLKPEKFTAIYEATPNSDDPPISINSKNIELGLKQRKARLASPAIVFFDEIDAIAPKRGFFYGDSNVTTRVISQLLTELDGLEALSRDIVIVAATNRLDIIDTALIRPGRIDRMIKVDAPDEVARLSILKIFSKNMPLDTDVNLQELSKLIDGFAGSDIEALCSEAGLIALRENIKANKVTLKHFKAAMSKIHPTITAEMKKFFDDMENQFKQPVKQGKSLPYT